jgi:pimeloyl-ACP methyl ester carboxylesterase
MLFKIKRKLYQRIIMIKKLVILFLSAVVAFGNLPAQTPTMTTHILGPLTQYRSVGTNLKIPFLQCLSADANQTRAGTGFVGKKYPVIIAFHGAGEKTTSYASSSTVSTGDINSLYNTSLPSLLRYTTSTLYNDRYAAPGTTDSTSFIYLFPQTYGGYTYTYPIYPKTMIQYIKDSLSDIADTNRIYLAGLSLGGGAVLTALQIPEISEDVAAAIAMCPGYLTASTTFNPYNMLNMADWGGLLILGHSTNDSTTDKHPTTREGSYYSDRARDSLYFHKGITHLIYKKWVTGGHTVWDRAYHPDNSGNTYMMSNNQNGNFPINFHSLFLSYKRSGRVKVRN